MPIDYLHGIAKDLTQAIIDLANAYGLGGVSNLLIKATRAYDWDEVDKIMKSIKSKINTSDYNRVISALNNFQSKSNTQAYSSMLSPNKGLKRIASEYIEDQEKLEVGEKAKTGILSKDQKKLFKETYKDAKISINKRRNK